MNGFNKTEGAFLRAGYASRGLSLSSVLFNLLQLVLSACVVAVKCAFFRAGYASYRAFPFNSFILTKDTFMYISLIIYNTFP